MPIILSCYWHGKPTLTFKWLVPCLEQSSRYICKETPELMSLINERLSELPEGASQRKRWQHNVDSPLTQCSRSSILSMPFASKGSVPYHSASALREQVAG